MRNTWLCMFGFFYGYSQKVEPEEIKATLTATTTIIPLVGSVSLTCSVDQPAELMFELLRGRPPTTQTAVPGPPDGVFSVREGGIYTCRGFNTKENIYTTISNEVIIMKTVPNKPSLIQKPTWSLIYRGEIVTLRCKIEGDGGTQWMYEWRPTSRISPTSSEYTIISADEFHSQEYSCMGRRGYELTEWSDTITLTVLSDKPRATLAAEERIIPAGGSINLTCSVVDSIGWIFDWRTNPPHSQHYVLRSSTNNDQDGVLTVIHEGRYVCRGRRGDPVFFSETSSEVIIQRTVSTLPVILQPIWSLTEERVSLECDIQGETWWTYEWRRNNSPASIKSGIITADSGEYSCRGSTDYLLTQWSDVITLTIFPIKPSLIRKPIWSPIYRGEQVTLRCEIKGDGRTQWTYEWRPYIYSPTSSEYRINTATEPHSQEYRCMGRRGYELTEWSDAIGLTVLSSQPVLSVSPSWLSPGASVTLSCGGLEHPSAGWSFFWYKAVPETSSSSYRFELLANSTNGTEVNSYIINGPTHTAGYVCRAGRGEPLFYTDFSIPTFAWSGDRRPAGSLSVSPDRAQHFEYDSVSLSCEGNSTEWRVMRLRDTGQHSYFTCSYWDRLTGSKCTITLYGNPGGVYWCEAKSGEFSNAVNITVQDYSSDGIILVSPVHPVTEGDPVTLSCRDKEQKLLSNVFFYHDDKLLHNDSRGELNISAVSKSVEGFYKCKHSGKESPQSWMSVRVTASSPVGPLFPVLLVIGPVSGIIFIILLLVFWRYKLSKGLFFLRSERPNQRVNMNDGVEKEMMEYVSSPQVDALRKSAMSHEATATADSKDITYSMINFKLLRKKRRPCVTEERVIYAEVNVGAAELSPTYAEINHEIKSKKKKKYKPSPAATDESLYSEIKPGSAIKK